MKSFLALLTVATALVRVTSAAPINASSIQCEEGKTGCSECYITLVKCLMYNDQNALNLIEAFLPPTQINPVFMKVDYQFPDGLETKTWFWTSETSTLLYPLNGFQFFSLFFGNIKPFRSGKVAVTLPSECFDADQNFFKILTQRLKVHASTLSVTPLFRDSDDAISGDVDFVEKNIHTNHLAAILYLYQIFAPIFLTVGMGIAICLNIDSIIPNLKKGTDRNASDSDSSFAFSIAVVSFMIVTYAIAMDCFGIVFATRDSVPEYSDAVGDYSTKALFHLPLVMLILYDILCFIAWCSAFVVWCCNYRSSDKKSQTDKCTCNDFLNCNYWCWKNWSSDETRTSCEKNCNMCTCFCPKKAGTNGNDEGAAQGNDQLEGAASAQGNDQGAAHTSCKSCCKSCCTAINSHPQKYIISASLLAVIFVLSTHSYFIIIAFISDPVHANSIGIYYVITVVVFLLVSKWLWICLSKAPAEDGESTEQNCDNCCVLCLKIFFAVLSFIALAVFQILTTTTFVFNPVKRTIDDVPAQISSIYQSLFVVFGALITYQIFIKKNTSLESIVKSALVEYAKKKNLNQDTAQDEQLTDTKTATKLVEYYLEKYYP